MTGCVLFQFTVQSFNMLLCISFHRKGIVVVYVIGCYLTQYSLHATLPKPCLVCLTTGKSLISCGSEGDVVLLCCMIFRISLHYTMPHFSVQFAA